MQKPLTTNRTMGRYCILLSAAALMSALAGCATGGKLPNYHADAISPSSRSAQAAGMQVVVDPFVETARTQQYFGINAASDGIGIIYVQVSNRTTNHTFLVEKKNFQLVPLGAASGQNADSTTIKRNSGGGEATVWIGAVSGGVGGLALMFAGGSMIAHAAEVQRNFIGKEMPDQTLSPGESMEGFIYFQPVKKDKKWCHGAVMNVSLEETRSHERIAMPISLSE
jgi:hypothetical protein